MRESQATKIGPEQFHKIPQPANFYNRWRGVQGFGLSLHEDPNCPPERLLQSVWFHQRLLRHELTTRDGRRVRILHPGFWNKESGPDFREALVQFENETPRTGDVEVDLASAGWQAHGHERNKNFAQVILHVIWDGDVKTSLPTLALKGFLDSSLDELALWLGSDSSQIFPEALQGLCAQAWREVGADKRLEMLRQAAQVRLRSKAALLQARARQAGWEQALWEGLFRALGYKHNSWAMQCLAELQASGGDTLFNSAPRANPLAVQARLFGLSGLLPDEITRAQPGTDQYVRRLWDFWWRERESLADRILPRSLWRFHGLRPANHPQRRLALASHWLANPQLVSQFEKWSAQSLKSSELLPSLLGALQVGKDDFWSWHWTLRSPRLPKAQPMLGATRVTDLAVNVILPWLWIRAVEGGNEKLQNQMEQRYLNWPAAEDNSVLRLARQRMLGGASKREFKTAALQQGLLQVVRDFCENTNPICEHCRLPELLHKWSEVQPGQFAEEAGQPEKAGET